MGGLRHTEDGLAYELAGDGPPVLLVHAGIADRTMWDPQWERWSERFTLLRYDQRGFGDSPDPSGKYSLHGDALAVLDDAGVDRAAVVGASMGGKAALDLTLAAPERVDALVAVVATPSGWQHSADLISMFEAVDGAYERDGLEAANEVELSAWVDGPQRDPEELDPAVRAKVKRMNHAALEREEAAEQRGAAIEPTDLGPPGVDRLDEVKVPVLVVTGALDQPSVNAGAAAIAAGVAGALSAEIAGSAHMPSLERPDEFDAAVLPFLDAVAAAGRS